MSNETIRYRPVWGRVLAVAVIVVCALGAVGFLLAEDWEGAWRTLPFLTLLGTLAWATFWRPELVIEPHGLRVVNVFRTVDVAWPAIQRLDTRFALTIYTHEGRVGVWTAPSPGVRGTVRIGREDVRELPDTAYGPGGTVRPGDALGTASGDAGYLVRRRWEQLRDAGLLDRGAEAGSVRRSWHVATIAAVAALAVACVVALVVPSA